MNKLIAALLFMCSLAFAQSFPSKQQVIYGTGAPSAGKCTSASVGLIYVRLDQVTAGNALYVCNKTGSSTYIWSLSAGGGGGTGNITMNTGTADPTAACTPQTDFYTRTDTTPKKYYVCDSSGTYRFIPTQSTAGTIAGGVGLAEKAANGTSAFYVMGLDAQSANYCITMPDENPASSEVLQYAGSTESKTLEDGTSLTCYKTQWAAAGGGSGGGVVRVAYASLPATCDGSNTNTEYVFTDSVGIRAQCNGSSYSYTYGDWGVTLPGVVSGWTQVNVAGTSTLTDKAGAILWHSTGTNKIEAILKSLGGATDVRALAYLDQTPFSGTYPACGLVMTNGTNSTTSTYVRFTEVWMAYQSQWDYLLDNNTNMVSPSNNGGTVGPTPMDFTRPKYMRMVYSGGNITAYTSGDGGQSWKQYGVIATGFTPTHYGFTCQNETSAVSDATIVSLYAQ